MFQSSGQWAFDLLEYVAAQSIPEEYDPVQVSGSTAAFPTELWQAKIRRTALCDYLTRRFAGIVSAAGEARTLLRCSLLCHGGCA